MKALFARLAQAPWWAKVAAIIVILLIAFWFRQKISNGFEKFNQWRFDKAVAQKQAEIDAIKKQNAQLLEEAKKAYALGEAKELERDAAYRELEKYGAAARAAVEAQKEAAKEYEADKNRIAVDVPVYQRCKDLCAERAEVGYPCKPSVESYCARYSGR